MFNKIINGRVAIGALVAVFMIGFYALGYFVSSYFMDAFIAFVIFLAVNEMRIALRANFTKAIEVLIIVYSAGIVFPYLFLGFMGVVYFAIVIFIVASCMALFKRECPPHAIQNIALILVYPGLALSSLLFLNDSYLNYLGLALVLCIATFTDMFAMLGGMLFGKHKLAPEISPKKTVEGAVAGIVGGMVGAGLVFVAFEVFALLGTKGTGFIESGVWPPYAYLAYALLGIFASAFTQIGDLLASYFKRQLGIKDYSKLLGSHGGVMDRFDGIMFASCFVSLIFTFIV